MNYYCSHRLRRVYSGLSIWSSSPPPSPSQARAARRKDGSCKMERSLSLMFTFGGLVLGFVWASSIVGVNISNFSMGDTNTEVRHEQWTFFFMCRAYRVSSRLWYVHTGQMEVGGEVVGGKILFSPQNFLPRKVIIFGWFTESTL